MPTPDVSAGGASPLALLSMRDFRNVWLAGAMVGILRWLDMLAVSVYVVAITGSPLLVALMFFLRMVPLFLFGMIAGALAETMDRRKLLVTSLGLLAAVYTVLAWLALAGWLELWHLGIGVFLGGVGWALDLSFRRTVIAEIAGLDSIGAAMGLDASTTSFTRMLGPFIGGFIFELTGLYATLILGAALYAAAAGLLAFVNYQHVGAGERTPMFETIADGLRFARRSRFIVATLTVTVIFNLFGFSFVSMVPVIAKEELGLSPFPTGILMSAEGCGSFLGCLLIAFFAEPMRFRQVYVGGASLYLCCILVFALSPYFALSLPALWIAGFGVAGFATMQSALIISASPVEMRTRVMGILSMCIGFAPIGMLFVGVLAERWGAVTGVVILASAGFLAMIGTMMAWPEMLRAHST